MSTAPGGAPEVLESERLAREAEELALLGEMKDDGRSRTIFDELDEDELL